MIDCIVAGEMGAVGVGEEVRLGELVDNEAIRSDVRLAIQVRGEATTTARRPSWNSHDGRQIARRGFDEGVGDDVGQIDNVGWQCLG